MTDERDFGEKCDVCNTRYLTVYWLPDDVWTAITPRPGNDGGGLLCPSCADQRARETGICLSWSAAAGA